MPTSLSQSVEDCRAKIWKLYQSHETFFFVSCWATTLQLVSNSPSAPVDAFFFSSDVPWERPGPMRITSRLSKVQWKPFWAYHPALSTEWLGWVAKWCEWWRMCTCPIGFKLSLSTALAPFFFSIHGQRSLTNTRAILVKTLELWHVDSPLLVLWREFLPKQDFQTLFLLFLMFLTESERRKDVQRRICTPLYSAPEVPCSSPNSKAEHQHTQPAPSLPLMPNHVILASMSCFVSKKKLQKFILSIALISSPN